MPVISGVVSFAVWLLHVDLIWRNDSSHYINYLSSRLSERGTYTQACTVCNVTSIYIYVHVICTTIMQDVLFRVSFDVLVGSLFDSLDYISSETKESKWCRAMLLMVIHFTQQWRLPRGNLCSVHIRRFIWQFRDACWSCSCLVWGIAQNVISIRWGEILFECSWQYPDMHGIQGKPVKNTLDTFFQPSNTVLYTLHVP